MFAPKAVLKFPIAFDDYFALAQQPVADRHDADIVAQILKINADQAAEFIRTDDDLNFFDFKRMVSAGVISRRLYDVFTTEFSLINNLLHISRDTLEDKNWKTVPKAGKAIREELARIYATLDIPNDSLKSGTINIVREPETPEAILKAAGFDQKVIVRLFQNTSEEATKATPRQQIAARATLLIYLSPEVVEQLLPQRNITPLQPGVT